jgi:hypothetical protein
VLSLLPAPSAPFHTAKVVTISAAIAVTMSGLVTAAWVLGFTAGL